MQSGFAVAFALFLTPLQSPQAKQEPVWLTDYDKARSVARSQDRPIFAVFVCMH
jgi:hypothetical protein